MVILNIPGTRSNGHNRTLRRSDREHDKGEVRANGNAPYVIEGNGNCIISGDADPLEHCNTFGDGP